MVNIPENLGIKQEDLDPYFDAVRTVQLFLTQYITRDLGLKEERVTGRVKRIDDIYEKIRHKDYDVKTKQEVFNRMNDIAGTRVVCDYLSEVKEVVEFISICDKFNVEEEYDYVNKPDCAGYRSYHCDVNVDTLYFGGVKCEIQIRTTVQHSWAEKSHPLIYKKNKNEIPKIACDLLKTLSNHLYTADEYAETIRSLIKKDENRDKDR